MLAYTDLIDMMKNEQVSRFIFIQHTKRLTKIGNTVITVTVLAECFLTDILGNKIPYIVNVTLELSQILKQRINRDTHHMRYTGNIRQLSYDMTNILPHNTALLTFIDW